VRSTGLKQDGTEVVDYVRWVMVRKRDDASVAPEPYVPKLPSSLLPTRSATRCRCST
jgi:2-methylfumaryl-CoA hydratase